MILSVSRKKNKFLSIFVEKYVEYLADFVA